MNPICFWYNSLLIKWFTSVEVEIWTKVLTKKCLYAKILKTGIFMLEYRFFLHCQKNFLEQTIDLGNSTKCYKVTCFPKLENWHVAEGTLYRFHSIHMIVLFDLPSVLILFAFGNSLMKTYFEAKAIKSNWKLKTMLFFRTCSDNVILPQLHSILQKTHWYRFRLFLRWRWIKYDFLCN